MKKKQKKIARIEWSPPLGKNGRRFLVYSNKPPNQKIKLLNAFQYYIIISKELDVFNLGQKFQWIFAKIVGKCYNNIIHWKLSKLGKLMKTNTFCESSNHQKCLFGWRFRVKTNIVLKV